MLVSASFGTNVAAGGGVIWPLDAKDDIKMNGKKLILDDDEDSYFFANADDDIRLFVGNAEYSKWTGAELVESAAIRMKDAIEFRLGGAVGGDIAALWDSSETNHKGKIGLPSSGEGFVLGPIADNGVNRYGATALPFGWWVRADDADQSHRVGMYHNGTDGIFSSQAGALVLAVGGVAKLRITSTYLQPVQELRMDDLNILTGTGTGCKLCTSTNQKLGFWNAAPIIQPAHIADPSGGATIDAEARTAIAAINAMLAATGLTASS